MTFRLAILSRGFYQNDVIVNKRHWKWKLNIQVKIIVCILHHFSHHIYCQEIYRKLANCMTKKICAITVSDAMLVNFEIELQILQNNGSVLAY